MRPLRLLLNGVLAAALVGGSFMAGWSAHARAFASSRRIHFDFSQRYLIPPGFESISTSPSPATSPFNVGDRIDILAHLNGSLEPLIIDALVTNQSNSNFQILVPSGGRGLLSYARENQVRLVYRLSNSTM